MQYVYSFRRHWPLAALLACLLMPPSANALDLQSCRIFDTAGVRSKDAQCLRLLVAENPDEPQGKQIELFVAVIRALAPTPAADPLIVIQGGPGGSSVEMYVSMAAAFDAVRKTRDIVLVDQRGTGQSNALHCDVPEDEPVEFDPELAEQLARECLSSLPGDPRFYTTSVAVQDLEAVRQALGYPQLNLYGVSYGSRVALHYLRRFPEQTRSVTIDGVVPPQWSLGPDIALFSQNTLDDVFQRCADNEVCAGRFGDLATKMASMTNDLEQNPRELLIPHPLTGREVPLTFTRQHLTLAVRMMSYDRESQALLPLLISEGEQGNFQPLAAQAHMAGESLSQALALGMHNAIVCTEDLPFVDSLSDDRLRDTYMGSVQMQALRAFCKDWPRGLIDEDFKQPVRSPVPTLVLSGEFDPVTPPANGDLAASTLSMQKTIVAPGQGHGVVMRGCLPRLLARFVETADPSAVDDSCVQRMGPLGFFQDFSGPMP